MSTYTYANQNIYSPSCLYQALVFGGVYDAVFNIEEEIDGNGDLTGLHLVTVVSSQPQALVDAGVANGNTGTFLANKTALIDQVNLNTGILASSGITFTRPSDGALNKGPLDLSYDTRTNLRNLKSDISDGFVSMPQLIDTIDGRGIELFTLADVDAAYLAVVERGQYLLNNGQNADLSYGQSALIKSITSAQDQATLDLISDSRT